MPRVKNFLYKAHTQHLMTGYGKHNGYNGHGKYNKHGMQGEHGKYHRGYDYAKYGTKHARVAPDVLVSGLLHATVLAYHLVKAQ
jgi:hypothetical protein